MANPFGDEEPDEETKKARLKEYEKHFVAGRADFEREYALDGCPDEQVSDYTALFLIGMGTFGAVFVGQKGDIHRAIKVQVKAKVRREAATLFVIAEKRLHFSIKDTFVISLLAKYKDRKHLYMILERAIHGDLYRLARSYRGGRVPEARVRQIMAQVAMGLGYIHSCNVVHRDMKPVNILICEGGRVKITDFGDAAIIGPSLFRYVGDPIYMSPERLAQQPYNDASDWYSYGVILFYLMHGVIPYGAIGMPEIEILAAVNSGVINRMFNVGICSADLKSLITQLLQRNPADRIGTWARGVDDVKEHAWFKSVDWYQVTFFRQQFELTDRERRARRLSACPPDVFKNIGKHETDDFDEY